MLLSSPLYPVVILLTSGVAGLTLSRFFSLSPIVGFFIIGAIIGPKGFGFINDHAHELHFLGELGVCFLLFDVGLHLSIKELRAHWKQFIAVGTLQFIAATFMIGMILILLGMETASAIILGVILSLSSTALVLKMLSEHHEETSPVGKKATEILVFQDVVGIMVLVFLTGAAPGTEGDHLSFSVAELLLPVGKMILAAVSMVVIGRIGLKPLFKLLIAVKNEEVFTSFALLIVFFTSWVTQSLGLSLALGAFLGGLALSESTYSYIVRTEVAPFRGLLLALFFLTVGMSLDLKGIFADWEMVLGLLTAFYLIKASANWLALRLSGMEKPAAIRLAFLLSQGSEFAFVLLAAAQAGGLLPAVYAASAISVVGLSLALTPILGGLGCALSRSQCHLQSTENLDFPEEESEVVIVEFDDFARDLAGILSDAGVKYRGHDRDVERLTYAKSRGFDVYYSDPNRPRTLGRLSAGKVKAVVSLLEDDEILSIMVREVKRISPETPIVAATSNPARLELLNELGVENAFIKSKSSLAIVAETLLNEISVPSSKIKEVISKTVKGIIIDGPFPRTNPEALIPAAVMQ